MTARRQCGARRYAHQIVGCWPVGMWHRRDVWPDMVTSRALDRMAYEAAPSIYTPRSPGARRQTPLPNSLSYALCMAELRRGEEPF